MAKKVVTDGSKPTAKKQRIAEEEAKAAADKVEFSLAFTTQEEKAWINEERCNTIVLVVSIFVQLIIGTVAAFISHTMGLNSTSALVDTVMVFQVAQMLRNIATPFVKMYAAKHYNLSSTNGLDSSLVQGRSIAMQVFMYLVMALGTCIVIVNLL